MTQALTLRLSLLRNVVRRMFAAPVAGLLNIMVIGIALSLPTGMYVLLLNAQDLVTELSSTPQISLFMELTADKKDIDELRKKLEPHPAIIGLEFIPRDQALKQLQQSTGRADVIGVLKENPLPNAFVIHPKPEQAHALEALRTELSKLSKVKQAQLDSSWAYKLEAILKFGRALVIILACLLSLALVSITFNTIRLQILTQREEIEVSKLIGATNAFIRRPFLYFGATQGFLGGIAAYLILTISLWLLNLQLETLSQLYASEFSLQSLTMADTLTLLLFSLYLGLMGSWLSVARHLSQIEPR
ncbi:MAG: permease-like cell division protein FtsX [Gallionella sp.]